jgi:Protein of unknown function (DUF1638)
MNIHSSGKTVLIIACGALAKEILAVIKINELAQISVTCLPAKYHNTPMKIPAALRAKIREGRKQFDNIFVAYGDCGTGGAIDAVLEEEGVSRIGGAHCYAFFSGVDRFETMHLENLGTFYLTDFLVRHFDTLIVKGMGLDRFPKIRDLYFGNYERLVYLAQTDDDILTSKARDAAKRLELTFVRQFTGYGDLATSMLKL